MQNDGGSACSFFLCHFPRLVFFSQARNVNSTRLYPAPLLFSWLSFGAVATWYHLRICVCCYSFGDVFLARRWDYDQAASLCTCSSLSSCQCCGLMYFHLTLIKVHLFAHVVRCRLVSVLITSKFLSAHVALRRLVDVLVTFWHSLSHGDGLACSLCCPSGKEWIHLLPALAKS